MCRMAECGRQARVGFHDFERRYIFVRHRCEGSLWEKGFVRTE